MISTIESSDKKLTKEQVYQELFDLSNQGVDVTEVILELAVHDDPPESVLQFIDEHTTQYPEFIESLSHKKFYKTIMDESATINEQAKALSSLITHTLIEHELTNQSLNGLARSVIAYDALNALSAYLSGDSSKVVSTYNELRSLFSKTNN